MSDENTNIEGNDDGLSAEDRAYFESGGEIDTAPEGDEPETPVEASAEPKNEPEQPEAGATQESEPERQSMVPHQALHAEREGHKQTKAELMRTAERMAVLESRLEQLNSMLTEARQEEPPSIDEDPIGRIQYLDKQLAKMQEEAVQREQQQQQFYSEQQAFQAKFNAVNMQAEQIAASDPSFQDAIEHIGQSLANEAVQLYGMSQQEAQQYRQDMFRRHIEHMHDTGADVGAYVRNMATLRGFQAQPRQGQPDQGGALAEKIAQQAAASERHKSLTAAGGTTPRQEGVDILSMSDAEFAKWAATASDAERMRALS